jgi:tetratricopeptide (TPR) repeat protein
MDESHPQPLQEKPDANRFARIAVVLSILTPLIVLLASFLLFKFLEFHGHSNLKTAFSVGFLFLFLLPVAGLLLGIVAIAIGRRRNGIIVGSVIGILFNGLFLLSLFLLPFLVATMIGHQSPRTPQDRLDKDTKELAAASTDEDRFYALDNAAKDSFNVGKIQDAQNYAQELLKTAPRLAGNWNYGNAIQDGNLVLGRIAVKAGQIEEAKKYLLEAGKSPGSPQMNSFGPNMSLAKDLLEKGERDTVLQYFDECRKFWESDYGKLDEWSKEVKAGRIPHFGANLVY